MTTVDGVVVVTGRQTSARGPFEVGRAPVVAALLLLFTGCGKETVVIQKGLTGIDATIVYDGALGLDQIRVSGRLDDGTAVFPATARPEPPQPLTTGETSVVILLNEALAGSAIYVRGDGLVAGTVSASDQERLTLLAAALVPVTLALGDQAICGDGRTRAGIETCDDGNDWGTDGCSAVCLVEADWSCTTPDPGPSVCTSNLSCDAQRCTTGCCSGADCVAATFDACGVEARGCAPCDPIRADDCIGGECTCGEAAACLPGQHCVLGACVCDPTSCANGCCADNRCQLRSVDACAPAGDACAPCDPVAADTCGANGECRCGSLLACALGQHCDPNGCHCDATTCDGCCTTSGVCDRGDQKNRCGSAGADCTACTGPGAACDAGACDACTVSCGGGCCTGSTCHEPAELSFCGAAGDACVWCDPTRADNCGGDGHCHCGLGAACAPGSVCGAQGCAPP
ncbi:MAG: hypothetical protein HY903_23380 [Deltaproteobacteria bacterium]|nr:hypothetical protein [Deltaproteobacteria bacterium]